MYYWYYNNKPSASRPHEQDADKQPYFCSCFTRKEKGISDVKENKKRRERNKGEKDSQKCLIHPTFVGDFAFAGYQYPAPPLDKCNTMGIQYQPNNYTTRSSSMIG